MPVPRETIDGTIRDCAHAAKYPHGTVHGYEKDLCRCLACRAAISAYRVARRKQRAYGRSKVYVDASAAREHVNTLRESGMSSQAIAAAAGCPTTWVKRLIYGAPSKGVEPTAKATPERVAAILAVTTTPAGLPPRSTISTLGTRRRVQALATLGYSTTDIEARIDMLHDKLRSAITREQITAGAAARIARVYDELCMTPKVPTNRIERQRATRVRNLAAAKGYAPPLSWDDIDNPNETPKHNTKAAA